MPAKLTRCDGLPHRTTDYRCGRAITGRGRRLTETKGGNRRFDAHSRTAASLQFTSQSASRLALYGSNFSSILNGLHGEGGVSFRQRQCLIVMGFRSDPKTPRYAIVDVASAPFVLLNADTKASGRKTPISLSTKRILGDAEANRLATWFIKAVVEGKTI
jgi:hypothetical protein